MQRECDDDGGQYVDGDLQYMAFQLASPGRYVIG